MKMYMDIQVQLDGEWLTLHEIEDDVDAEGTMIAKHYEPIIDAVVENGGKGYIFFGNLFIPNFTRVNAIRYEIYPCQD